MAIALATPGLIFDLCKQVSERSGTRLSRDIVRLVSDIVLVSVPVGLMSFYLLNVVGEGLGSRFAEDVSGNWNGHCAGGCAVTAMINRSVTFVVTTSLFAALAGLVFGKLSVWVLYARRWTGTPVQQFKSGLLPPSIEASVLSTTQVDGGNLVYRGLLRDIQMGPEGKVDFVVLSEPEKSIMRCDPMSKWIAPKAGERFSEIGREAGGRLSGPKDSFLVIESEDIANVFLRRGQVEQGDFFDQRAKALFGDKRVKVPAEKPPSGDKPPSRRPAA